MAKLWFPILLIALIAFCGLASADVDAPAELTDNNLTDVYTVDAVDTSDFATLGTSTGGVKFDTTEASTGEFVATTHENNDTITITAVNEPVIENQTVGIPISAISDAPVNMFDCDLLVTHYDEAGVMDWQKVVDPYIIGDMAYVDVQFSTVTITSLRSMITNWSFETWTSGTTESHAPDNWTMLANGGSRSTDAKLGAYSYKITGNGDAVRGLISQSTTRTAQYTVVDGWFNVSGRTSGRLNIDCSGGSPSVDSSGITIDRNTTGWEHFSFTEYVGGSNYGVRVFVDGTPNTGSVFLVDGVIVAGNNTLTATENIDASHLYMNFTHTPPAIYPTSTHLVKFVSYNISQFNVASIDTKIDGNTVSSYIVNDSIYIDASGLSMTAHNFNVTVNYTPSASIHGHVFGSDSGKGIQGGVAYLTWENLSMSRVTDSNGDFEFSNLPSGVYTVQATATGYDPSPSLPITFNGIAVFETIALKKTQTYYQPHYVKFKVTDQFLQAHFSGASVSVYKDGSNMEDTPDFNGITGADGSVTFQLTQDERYTLVTTFEGNTQTDTLYPSDDTYYIIFSGTGYSLNPGQLYDHVSFNVTKDEIDSNNAYVNASVYDDEGKITAVHCVLGTTAKNGSFVPAQDGGSQGLTGNYSNKSFAVQDYLGNDFVVRITINHPEYGEVTKVYGVGFNGNHSPFSGSKELGYLCLFLIFTVAMMFGREHHASGSVLLCAFAWVFYFIGLFDGFGTAMEQSIFAGMIAATVFAIMALINANSEGVI
ncbi:MAG: carboxypeptidase regulatory-like domain-containing protein [Methanosarcina sp.]